MDNYSSVSVHQFSYQPGGYTPGGYNPGPGGYPGSQPWSGGQLAGLGGRIVAFLIDRFLIGIIIGAAYVLMGVLALAGASTQTDAGATLGGLGAMLVLLVLIPAALVVMLFNEVYLAGKNNGQTICKKMIKIRGGKED